jgi:DNA polymerase-1
MSMSDKRLLLIDGTNILYRAFFAIADLATGAGQPTNAVFGFVRMLRQWLRQWQPTHQLVVWDGGTPERRKVLLPEYKAHRPAMPDALRRQFALADEYLDRAGIAHMRMDGEEADDVMASLAQRATPEAEVLLVTSDKDMLQLVTERIRVILPVRTGARSVRRRYSKNTESVQTRSWLGWPSRAMRSITSREFLA